MRDLRYAMISAMLKGLRLARIDRIAAPIMRGRGVILTLHHVWKGRELPFQPNRILEIAPDFLDAVLTMLRAEGHDIIAMDEVPGRLAQNGPPFVALTFDDGYRDNLTEALPVLRRHGAPFTVYVVPGFAEASAPLWWRDLEDVVRDNAVLEVPFATGSERMTAATGAEKRAAFKTIYWRLRAGPESELRRVIDAMAIRSGIDPRGRLEQLCLRWEGLATLAREPLCTIGAHTMTHPMLAKHPADVVRDEMNDSRDTISARLGVDIRHFSYPVGDPGSAGPREFALAKEAGFATAVTTRPGVLFGDHAAHLHALPRISLNGLFQSADDIRVLLSGVPTGLQNRLRKVNVG